MKKEIDDVIGVGRLVMFVHGWGAVSFATPASSPGRTLQSRGGVGGLGLRGFCRRRFTLPEMILMKAKLIVLSAVVGLFACDEKKTDMPPAADSRLQAHRADREQDGNGSALDRVALALALTQYTDGISTRVRQSLEVMTAKQKARERGNLDADFRRQLLEIENGFVECDQTLNDLRDLLISQRKKSTLATEIDLQTKRHDALGTLLGAQAMLDEIEERIAAGAMKPGDAEQVERLGEVSARARRTLEELRNNSLLSEQ